MAPSPGTLAMEDEWSEAAEVEIDLVPYLLPSALEVVGRTHHTRNADDLAFAAVRLAVATADALRASRSTG